MKEKLFDLSDHELMEILLGCLAEGHNVQESAIIFGGIDKNDWEEDDFPFTDEWLIFYNRRAVMTRAIFKWCKMNNIKTASEYHHMLENDQITEEEYAKKILYLASEGYPFNMIFSQANCSPTYLIDGEEYETEQQYLEEACKIVVPDEIISKSKQGTNKVF